MWLFEDNHLLTLDKPAGLLSQADSTGDPDVVTLAKEYIKHKYSKPGNVYIGLVHRLDRPTSGAMVLARTSKAARRLSQAFRERSVKKKYIALVEGALTGSGVMEDYLRKEADRSYVVQVKDQGKYASLRWNAVESNGKVTLVSIELITGRAHQIRCQFSDRGFPVLGDIRYGAQQGFDGKDQIALHCQNLRFLHPVKKTSMDVETTLPSPWRKFRELYY
ncbi:MAG: RluA family pseudouridine synthase [Rhodothermaceae bacterium]|nr:RluA family pseudouridine synthase [Rhodothermaceae bacterium]MXZ17332.1 RluA family pseudouridine synthase [Rhodothermaceae bacterium]MXZ58411.1 RluA family pseudouridine synthase [Rhodothermaceae bacterium]MYB90126.1 RluA family pseudouridine synthase [Rhodothermaceae bacterium]MYD67122.1 RluA family pseudouridine synthase [Rhodothermaceae bacterium]